MCPHLQAAHRLSPSVKGNEDRESLVSLAPSRHDRQCLFRSDGGIFEFELLFRVERFAGIVRASSITEGLGLGLRRDRLLSNASAIRDVPTLEDLSVPPFAPDG